MISLRHRWTNGVFETETSVSFEDEDRLPRDIKRIIRAIRVDCEAGDCPPDEDDEDDGEGGDGGCLPGGPPEDCCLSNPSSL